MQKLKTKNYGLRADDTSFCEFKSVSMPEQKGDKIVTMNNQGFMRVELDPFSQKWINEASQNQYPFLEIGAAYGQASIKALKKGATIIANDIEMLHLAIIRNRVSAKFHKKLYLNCNAFPEGVELQDSSIGGVLFCRVGHFFTTEKMLESLKKIYNILVPGGSLYFTSVSPYHYTFAQDFLPRFLERKKRGEANPGYIENMKQYMPSFESTQFVPEFLNAWDIDTISKLLKISKFNIIEKRLFDYSKNNSNGKGFTGVQAIK
jgi:SAM-dependent methyltransferase